MEQDKLDDEFVKNFNVGYIFGKTFPKISEELLKSNKTEFEKNKSEESIKPITGIILGIEEFYNEKNKELSQSNIDQLSELRDIRERSHNDKEIDREL